jgi:biotin transport system substrate-specific component
MHDQNQPRFLFLLRKTPTIDGQPSGLQCMGAVDAIEFAPFEFAAPSCFARGHCCLSFPAALLWAVIGLLLTIGGTLLEASIVAPPWIWSPGGLQVYPLGVTFQVGAVLFAACVGGQTAGALSQIAYLTLGLSGLQIFTLGGGLGYLQQPTLGYLIGFVPGAWCCGWLATRREPQLELLAFSSLVGLAVIHSLGLIYLLLYGLILGGINLPELIWRYSILPLPAHGAIACAASVCAFALRRLLFY